MSIQTETEIAELRERYRSALHIIAEALDQFANEHPSLEYPFHHWTGRADALVKLERMEKEIQAHEFDDLADAIAKAEKKTGDSMTQPIPTGTYFTCQGTCYPHRGAIHNVHVFDESKDWGFFTYCEAAISEDRSRGFTVEEVVQP